MGLGGYTATGPNILTRLAAECPEGALAAAVIQQALLACGDRTPITGIETKRSREAAAWLASPTCRAWLWCLSHDEDRINQLQALLVQQAHNRRAPLPTASDNDPTALAAP